MSQKLTATANTWLDSEDAKKLKSATYGGRSKNMGGGGGSINRESFRDEGFALASFAF